MINMPILNSSQLDQIRSFDVSGERQLLQKFLCIFLDSSEKYMEQLEQALQNDDGNNLYRAAHTFKSSTVNVGADALSELLRQLEEYGRAGEMANARLLQQSLRQQYQLVIDEVKAIIGKS
ncbi:MAG: Hpt domain-containing protein [Nitrosomonas sp. PRO4]|nr:Hpt domain-containing protein [Nitrosomonas sp. PRO4]